MVGGPWPEFFDWQRIGFEFDAEACQSRSMSAKRMDQQRRWVVARAGKASEAGDENAQWHRVHACKVQAGILLDRGDFHIVLGR